MRRLGIFSFGDKDGIIDKYVIFMVGNMKEHMDKVICVVQHRIDPKWRPILERLCDVILEPKDCVNMSTAYAAGLQYASVYRNNYDQIVLFSDELAGPFTPLSDFFQKIDSSDADVMSYGSLKCNDGLHLLCFKKAVYAADDFESFVKELGENGLTSERIIEYVTNESYKWDNYFEDGIDVLCSRPEKIIREKLGPFISIKSFIEQVDTPYSPRPAEIYDEIALLDEYEEKFISEYVYRTMGEDYVTGYLGHMYILDRNIGDSVEPDILYMLWADNTDALNILDSYPEQRKSMLIICTLDDIASAIRERFPEIQVFTSSKNPLDAVTGSLLGAVVMRYKGVCFASLPSAEDSYGEYVLKMLLDNGKQIYSATEKDPIILPYEMSNQKQSEDTDRYIFAANTKWLRGLKASAGDDLIQALKNKAVGEGQPIARFTDRRIVENKLNEHSDSIYPMPLSERKNDRYKEFLRELLTSDNRRELAHLKHMMFSKHKRQELYEELFGEDNKE